MLKLLTLFLFKICGWKLIGEKPADLKKCVVVGAPHTSNFDFIFALAGLHIIDAPIRFLIKNDWLKNRLIGKLLKDVGAVGVDRSKSNTMVDALTNLLIESEEDLYLLITPEGTRKYTPIWKTGFYNIALKAKVPILLTGLDYRKKEAYVGSHFVPTGCYKRDMQILKDFYQNLTPKYPEKFSLQIYQPDEQAVCSG